MAILKDAPREAMRKGFYVDRKGYVFRNRCTYDSEAHKAAGKRGRTDKAYIGTISRESYVVTGKTNWTEEDTLRYGKCIYGVKKLGVILFPGDRTTISNRSNNFLVRNGISDEDLVKMGYTDLLRMWGCGRKTAQEIMQYRGTLLKKNLFN